MVLTCDTLLLLQSFAYGQLSALLGSNKQFPVRFWKAEVNSSFNFFGLQKCHTNITSVNYSQWPTTYIVPG